MQGFQIRRWLVVWLLAACPAALAQIMIVPPRPPRPPIPPPRPVPRPIPPPRPALEPARLVEHRVEARLRQGAVTNEATLVLHNPNATPYEGTLLYPVPGDAAVHGLSMTINGKPVAAELLSAEEARKLYEDTVRRLRDPALLEVAGRRLIRARVFPIPPNGHQTLRLTYSHYLAPEGGLLTYRYPLRAPCAAPGSLKKLSLVLDIESPLPIKSILSPTHRVDVVAQGERRAKVSFEAENTTPERDFILYVSLSDRAVGLHLVTWREAGKDGYFLALLGPGYEVSRTVRAGPRAVVFAIDTSGSMSTDDKIGQVRRALIYCLEHLDPGDRFNIIDFSTTARAFRPGLVPAGKAEVAEAVKYVRALEARGGTAIEKALQRAVEMGKGVETPYVVLFLTDGKPTIGASDVPTLLKTVRAAGLKNLRLFTFGVGYQVNTHLLDRLARENHGDSTYVTPGEKVDRRVVALHKKLSHPALTDVTLAFAGLHVEDVYPQKLPDLFYGSHLTVVGRYRGTGDKAVTLTGTVDGKRRTFTYEGAFAEKDTAADWLPRLWATRKIGYLLDEIRLHGDKKELRDEVVRLSKEFGIVTPYTSFLVLEDVKARPRAQRGAGGRFMREHAEQMTPAAPAAREGLLRAKSGRSAVDAAVGLGRMRRAEAPAESKDTAMGGDFARGIRRVDGKTYYLLDGRWTVSTWDGRAETVKVKYLSDEYFRLARRHRALARAFALGPRVIAEFQGRFYEVIE